MMANVGLLLPLFPCLHTLQLMVENVDDVGLCLVAVCSQLHKLTLSLCHSVTPMGLYALCMRLPTLRSVVCNGCNQLKGCAVVACARLLREHGREVKLPHLSLVHTGQHATICEFSPKGHQYMNLCSHQK